MASAENRKFTLIVPASRSGEFFHRVLLNAKKIIEHDGGSLEYSWTKRTTRWHRFNLTLNPNGSKVAMGIREFDWADYLYQIARGMCLSYIAACNAEGGFPRAFLERLVPGFQWVSSMVPSARKGGGV